MSEKKTEFWLDILGNPYRRRILRMLAFRPMYSQEISRKLGISPRAVQKHLNQLHEQGVLKKEKVPRERGGKELVFFNLRGKPFFSYDITSPSSQVNFFNIGHKRSEEWKSITVTGPEDKLSLNFDLMNFSKLKLELKDFMNYQKDLRELERKQLEILKDREVKIRKIIDHNDKKKEISLILDLYQQLLVQFGTEHYWSVNDVMKILTTNYETALMLIDVLEKKLELAIFNREADDPRNPKWKLVNY